MALAVDHYFRIGTLHMRAGYPCEDYAISGVLPDGRVYGVVADGCSGARARTDVGARVLALAVEEELRGSASLDACFDSAFVDQLLLRIRSKPMGGAGEDYLASIVAFCAEGQRVKVYVAGDGAWAVKHADSSLQVAELHWKDETPCYLGYTLFPNVMAAFEAKTESEDVTIVTDSLSATGDVGQLVSAPLPGAALVRGLVLEFNLEAGSSLAVFSDGISQLKPTPVLMAAKELLAFKNYAGNYVKRRALAAFTAWGKASVVPDDDFSMAAVSLTSE